MDFKQAQRHLNGLTAEEFLRDYWQKKPLLIRGAFPEFAEPEGNPLSPDELAGLALEDGISSRLILGSHRDNAWRVEHGPFTESRFEQLSESHWSLLVSDVEKHLPDFARYLEPFRFIPDWRIDDLMVSYAPKGGSVGKHTDEYDVFLLQTAGTRRWQIEEQRSQSANIEGLELKLLEQFQPAQNWLLEPGDMLYLPPGIAHYGVAEDDDCMTWSIGFRAPSWASLALDLVDTTCADLDESQRYHDGDLSLQDNPAELSHTSLNRVRDQLQQLLTLDDEHFQRWLGSAVSQQAAEFPVFAHDEPIDAIDMATELKSGRSLQLSPFVRLNFTQSSRGGYWAFINGQEQHLSSPLLPELCALKQLDAETVDLQHFIADSELLEWVAKGYQKGYWLWQDELSYDEEPEEDG